MLTAAGDPQDVQRIPWEHFGWVASTAPHTIDNLLFLHSLQFTAEATLEWLYGIYIRLIRPVFLVQNNQHKASVSKLVITWKGVRYGISNKNLQGRVAWIRINAEPIWDKTRITQLCTSLVLTRWTDGPTYGQRSNVLITLV